MTYEKLRDYIIYDMKPDKAHGEEKNYQPVVIRCLNQTQNGSAKKDELIAELQKENPDRKITSGTLKTVTDTLIRNKVIISNNDSFELLDFESFSMKKGEKAEITKQCEKRIYQENESPNYLEILNEIVSRFRNDRESISATWTVGENKDNENNRNEFVKKYSLEKIKKLTIDEYVEGKIDSSGKKTRNNFCSELSDLGPFGRLEGREGPGIYGIYIKKDTQKFVFKPKMGKTSQEAFAKIKKSLVEILEYGKKSEFSKLDEIKDLDSRFKSKILAVYFPEKGLMIHAKSEVSPIAMDFKLFDKKEIYKKSVLEIQQSLLKFKDSHENLKNLNNLEYSHVLWYYSHGVKKDLKPIKLKQNTNNMTTLTEKIIELLNWKKNVILYGPPGTGKTYYCTQIIEEFTKNNKSKIAICYPSDQGIEKIEQFKKVIENKKKLLWGVGWGTSQILTSDYPVKGYIYFQGEVIAVANIIDITEHAETDKKDLELKPIGFGYDQDYKYYLHIDNLEIYPKSFTHKKLKMYDESKIVPDVVQQRVYVKELEQFHKFVTFHPSYSYEDFVEGIRPETINEGIRYYLKEGIFKKICDAARKDAVNNPDNKYLLIIDEVNRGNIAKIFGELITLIEKDKRNKLSLNLAYSQNKFTVPENLYIIGTMNTADKSLIEMDTALRRRFAFIELMPNHKLDKLNRKVGKVHLGDFLNALNEKIREQELRDKQIGHSYFMNISEDDEKGQKELQRVFKYEVIPLLQDYFYQDYDILEKILGGKIVSKTKMLVNEKFIDNYTKLEDELISIIKKTQKPEEESLKTPETSTD